MFNLFFVFTICLFSACVENQITGLVMTKSKSMNWQCAPTVCVIVVFLFDDFKQVVADWFPKRKRLETRELTYVMPLSVKQTQLGVRPDSTLYTVTSTRINYRHGS